jgi:hypothetical protein
MSNLNRKMIILFVILLSFPATNIISSGQNGRWRPEPVLGNPGLAFDSGRVPLDFLRNKAQVLGKASVYSKASGSVSQLTKGADELLQYTAGGHVVGFRKGEMFLASGDHALRVEFVNARLVSPVEEIKSVSMKDNRQAAQPLEKVTYRDLWQGVTLVYEKHGSGVVKSTYHIQPAGTGTIDPVGQIRLRYNMPVKVDDSGNLLLSFATGKMKESRAVAWQEIDEKRVPVDVAYRLLGEQEIRFNVGSYNRRYPLVIDPVLNWSTFLGSSSDDWGYAMAVDTSGNVYVGGQSNATWGSPVRPFAGNYDTFVAKLNGSGALQWNTFLGSPSTDYGFAIAVDTSGNVYVAGYSAATWGSPIRSFAGSDDAFAAKLNNNGALQWNTFLGGSDYDRSYGIAVDTSGNVYVAGYSAATWGWPIINPYAGNGDGFVAKLNGSGDLQWNTFLGGGSTEDGDNAIAVDTSGNIYVAGYSAATWGSPVRAFGGNCDTFVAKLNGSGALQWNTFLGGSSYDYGNAIAVDVSGNVYVTGYSNATWGSPVRLFAGTSDAFAAKLNGSGALQWSTFLGSSSTDYGNAIAVDSSGNVYVAGYSAATWGSPVRTFAGGSDAFVAKLNGSGAVQWNTFLGGSSSDSGSGVAVDTRRNAFVAGQSWDSWGSPIRPLAGSRDAFVAKIGSETKTDFNQDGYEDILWRYYGSGGKNALWYMKGATKIGYADVPAVTDLNWQIVGTGDFNGDGWPDILWRYYGSGGKNAVWYMKGATKIGYADVPAVTDLNWQIVGTGDFNGDGWPDVLWRYNGSGGKNAVWYMKGATYIGSAYLTAVTDLNWQIVGTGDFNGDGWPDILWRYNGSGGKNAVWYMKGATYIGSAFLPAVTDLNWQIVGTGDFNGDGWPDILWRYNGSGGKNALWYMKGATYIGSAFLPAVTDLNWKIENH